MSTSDKDNKKDSNVIDPPLSSTTTKTCESEDSVSISPKRDDFDIKKQGVIINDQILVDDHDKKQQCSPAVGDDEDDGFRTPTALENKIPMRCPPTPRKNRAPRKRKLESPVRSASILILDMSKEIEWLIREDKLEDELKRKMKNARKQMRRDDHHDHDDALT